jgi:hypothetical protein
MIGIPQWLSQSNISLGAVLATAVILAVSVAVIALLNRYIWKLLGSVGRHLPISYENSLMITRSAAAAVWIVWANVEILPEGVKGQAVSRDMMFTALREESGSTLQIPNNLFFQKMFRVSGNGISHPAHPGDGGHARTGEPAPKG